MLDEAGLDEAGTSVGTTTGSSGGVTTVPASMGRAGSTRSRGTSGSGEDSITPPAIRGTVSRNCAPIPGRPQAVSHPLCRLASSIEMASPRPVPPTRPGPGRIGSPEPVEHLLGLAGLEPDPVVADRHRHRVVVGLDQDVDRSALTVLDGVDQQVAHHPLDPARVDLGVARCRRVHPDLGPTRPGQLLRRDDHPVDHVAQVDLAHREHGRPGIEPRDLQQVGEQRLEPVELGLQQLGRAGGDRVEVLPRLVQHLGRHPYRGQRRPQLVGDVGDEALLDPGQLLELADLLLQLGGHVVHRGGEPGQVVAATDLHPVVQVARGETLGGAPGRPDRDDDLAGHQRSDEGQQHDQDRPGADHGGLQHGQDVHLLGEREDEVDLVPAGARQGEPGADRDAGHGRGVVAVDDLGRGHQQVVAGRDLGPQGVGDAGGRDVAGGDRLTAGDDDHVVLVAAAGAVGEAEGQLGELLVGVGITGEVGGVQLLLRRVERLSRLDADRVPLGLHHPDAGLPHQQEAAEHQDQDGGAEHRQDHPQRQRLPPPLDRQTPPAARLGAQRGEVRHFSAGRDSPGITSARPPCSRCRAPSPRSPGARDRARSSTAAAARAR